MNGIRSTCLAIAALFAAGIHAHETGTDHRLALEQRMAEFRTELGLTAQQQTDIQIITSDYADRLRDLAQLGRETADGLMNMSPDDPAYGPRTDEASALAASSAAEIVVLLAEMRGKLHAVLTPEQRAILETKRAEMRQRLEEKKEQQDGESHDRPLEQFIG